MRIYQTKGEQNMTLKECREERNLSTTQIAKKMGITGKQYVFYENNPEEIPADLAISFASIVERHIDDIFFTHHSN